ncbi:MAG: hypothetical protein DRJ52_00445 [Thermoprotei archaeon]|nr:MAG: hypothetical protein DRJ52_00445 [Thermoprotei archaeon]
MIYMKEVEELEVLKKKYDEAFRKLDEDLGKAEKMWSEYCAFIEKINDFWIRKSKEIEAEINSLKGIIEFYNNMKIETAINSSIGIISEEEATKRIEVLDKEISNIKSVIDYLSLKLSKYNDAIRKHLSRVGKIKIARKEDLIKKLKMLEEMKKRGEIDEITYIKLRSEIESLLKL